MFMSSTENFRYLSTSDADFCTKLNFGRLLAGSQNHRDKTSHFSTGQADGRNW